LRARVARLTNGAFINEGPMERGLRVDLGPTAVLKAGPIRLIVTSRCGAVNDPAFFALHGVELERTPLLLAKAKNHFRAAFAGVFDEIILAETPGPAMADCAALPFRHIPPDRFA
jgi:microcystin degradation protein MlrC